MDSLLKLAILALAIIGGAIVASQAQMIPYLPPTTQGTPVMGVASGADTSTLSTTLPAATAGSGKFTYICGVTISGLGATGLTTVVATIATLTGNKTASMTYIFPAGATVATTPINIQFSMCVPANAKETAITITVPGAAGNTATQINAHGYQL
jgi:hypothetical protein